MKKTDRDALMSVRVQAMLVGSLQSRMDEMEADGRRRAWLDDMPRSRTSAAGLDAALIRREEQQRILEREAGVLSAMERRAREAMQGMRGEMYAFCTLYYLRGMGMEQTADTLGRCVRQCKRYKREVEAQ